MTARERIPNVIYSNMPPKKTSTDAEATGLTPAENKFIKTMFDNMKSRPDSDWDKVAAQMNLKDSKCAKERFRQISARYGWNTKTSSGDGTSPSKVTKKPATGSGRKKTDTGVKKQKKEEADEEEKLAVKKETASEGSVKDESGTEEGSVKAEDEMKDDEA